MQNFELITQVFLEYLFESLMVCRSVDSSKLSALCFGIKCVSFEFLKFEFLEHFSKLILCYIVVLCQGLHGICHFVLEVSMSLNFIDDDIDDSENEKDKSSSATNCDSNKTCLGDSIVKIKLGRFFGFVFLIWQLSELFGVLWEWSRI